MAVAVPAALMQFLLVALAFRGLMTAYVTSDFSLVNVVQNSPFGEAADLQDHRRLGKP